MNLPGFARRGRYLVNGRRIRDGAGHEWDLRDRGISHARALALIGDPRVHVCFADCNAKLEWAADPKAAWELMSGATHFEDVSRSLGEARYEVSEWSGPAGPLLLFEELAG